MNKPEALRAGDYIHIQVPHNRYLATGVYRARIESVSPKRHHKIVAHCAVVVIGDDFDADSAFTVRFPMTIYDSAKLKGYCFLGSDEFPVEFRQEPNLERRLKDSITMPEERPRYADN